MGWISWRENTGSRTAWKACCSVALVVNMAWYFYAAGSSSLWICGMVFLAKAMTEIWGQDTPTWVCPSSMCLFLLVYIVGIPWVLATYALCNHISDIQFPYRDIVGVLLNVLGSAFSLTYELHRFWWKAKDVNKGKLFTIGLASLCIHPNYFGDLFTYTGWALASGSVYCLQLPLTLMWMFQFV